LCDMILRRRFDITTRVRVGNRFIKGASDILPLEDSGFDVIILDLDIKCAVGNINDILVVTIRALSEELEKVPDQQHHAYNDERTEQDGRHAVTRARIAIVVAVTTIVWPLWAVRAPLIGVALEHIYSLSIHKFRPAFLQVIPDHREWRCNTGYYFASYTYTILSSTGYHVKSRPTWSTGLGRYR